MSDYLYHLLDEIKKCNSEFEKQVCAWCIENYVPLTQFKASDDIYIAFYEKFCIDVVNETQSLFEWIGRTDFNISSDVVKSPSEMTKKHSSKLSGYDLIQVWKKNLSNETVKKGIRILDAFELSKIYDSNVMPKK